MLRCVEPNSPIRYWPTIDVLHASRVAADLPAPSAAKRAEVIYRATALVRERIESIATAMTLGQGKTLSQSRLEILRGCEIMEWDAMEGRRA